MAILGVLSIKGRIERAAALGWCLCLLATGLPATVQAATYVSGTIVSDVQWRAEDSPFEVVGDVHVANGATLTIEPGVTVYMRESTNVVVDQGALRALGASAQPITITSHRDWPGDTPAPGDWGELRLRGGTVAANTLLQH